MLHSHMLAVEGVLRTYNLERQDLPCTYVAGRCKYHSIVM